MLRPVACGDSALSESLALLDTIEPEMNAVRQELPGDEPDDWSVCASVIGDREFLRGWQRDVAALLGQDYDGPAKELETTAAACVLDSYAYAPGFLVGALFHISRRVPRVSPEVVAFRRDRAEHWISGTALLSAEFWCLPDDPAADYPNARVVADTAQLAAVARCEVRAHADRFLADYDPGVRLPRRALLGMFFDSLDSGPWIAEGLAAGCSPLESSMLLLPGRTEQFADASRLYALTDPHGRRHIARRRVACCESYRIDAARSGCFDCPRTTDEQRIELAADLPDPGACHD